jgi:hypothetical protein
MGLVAVASIAAKVMEVGSVLGTGMEVGGPFDVARRSTIITGQD